MESDVQRRLGELEATLFGVNGSNGLRMKVRDLESEMKTIKDERAEEKEERKSNERVRKGLIATVLGAVIVASIFQIVAAVKASATQEIMENAVKKLDAATQEIKANERL